MALPRAGTAGAAGSAPGLGWPSRLTYGLMDDEPPAPKEGWLQLPMVWASSVLVTRNMTYSADRATDTVPITEWASSDEDGDPWLAVALPGDTDVHQVAIRYGRAPEMTRFKVEVSMDAQGWRTVGAYEGHGSVRVNPAPTFSAGFPFEWRQDPRLSSLTGHGSYLRIHFVYDAEARAASVQKHVSIFELHVAGTPHRVAGPEAGGPLQIVAVTQDPNPIVRTGTLTAVLTGHWTTLAWDSSGNGSFSANDANGNPVAGRMIKAGDVVQYTRPDPNVFGWVGSDQIAVEAWDEQGHTTYTMYDVALTTQGAALPPRSPATGQDVAMPPAPATGVTTGPTTGGVSVPPYVSPQAAQHRKRHRKPKKPRPAPAQSVP